MAIKRGNNEGSIFKRKNGKWRTLVTVNGKRVSYSAKTNAECKRWVRKMLQQLDQGWDYDGSKTPLEEYLHQWLDAHKTTIRETTAQRYEIVIRKHIVPRIGDVKLKDLRLARIEHFYASLVDAGIGVRTIREVHAVLHKALKKAVRYDFIQSNPAHGAALPRYTHAEMQVFDESQVTQFLIAAHSSVHQALYHRDTSGWTLRFEMD